MAFGLANIIIAIVVVIVGITLGILAGKFVKKALQELEAKRFFKFPIDIIVSRVTSYIIYILAVIIALINLGIATIILYILLGFILFLLAIFIFLSLRDFLPNFVASITLQRRGLKKGDVVKFNSISGKVDEITITETRIKSEKDVVYVPNVLLVRNVLHVKEKNK